MIPILVNNIAVPASQQSPQGTGRRMALDDVDRDFGCMTSSEVVRTPGPMQGMMQMMNIMQNQMPSGQRP